jgi:low affinity Fe/Cu permease
MKVIIGLSIAALILVSLNLVQVKVNQESFDLEHIIDWEEL